MAVIGKGQVAREWLRLCLEHPHIMIAGIFNDIETAQPLRDIFPELHANLLVQPLHAFNSADYTVLAISETSSDFSKLLKQCQEQDTTILDLRPALLKNITEITTDTQTKITLALPEQKASDIIAANYLQSLPCVVYAAALVLQPLVEHAVPARGEVDIEVALPAWLEAEGSLEIEIMLEQLQHIITRPFSLRLQQEYRLGMARAIQLNLHFWLPDGYAEGDILAAYRQSYVASPFIRLVHPRRNPYNRPAARFLLGSNLVDIGFKLEPDSGKVTVQAACDLYGKASLGTMLQSFNLSQGWAESTGLRTNGLFLD